MPTKTQATRSWLCRGRYGAAAEAAVVVCEGEVTVQHRRTEEDEIFAPIAADPAVHGGEEPESGEHEQGSPLVEPPFRTTRQYG
jgi:hypothetical protein